MKKEGGWERRKMGMKKMGKQMDGKEGRQERR